MYTQTKEELARLKEAADAQLKDAVNAILRRIYGDNPPPTPQPSIWEQVQREKDNSQT